MIGPSKNFGKKFKKDDTEDVKRNRDKGPKDSGFIAKLGKFLAKKK